MNTLQKLGITKQPFLMIINGQTGSGKSHFLRFLMREINKSNEPFDFGIVMSNTSWEGSFDYVPPNYVFEEFNENVLKNLIKIQKRTYRKRYTNKLS
jgi:DNA helicase HerA-like ATPase